MLAVLHLLGWLNTRLLRVGRAVGWVALAAMVCVILLQVFMRYLFNNALNWPDEAARFLMLWMTGLMAPTAYRRGGFVAIAMLPRAMPRLPAQILSLVVLLLSLVVLVAGMRLGHDHTFGFGGRFDSPSLRLPLDWAGWESVKVKLRYMHMSLFICMILLASVNLELILRCLLAPAGAGAPADGQRTD